MAGIQALCTLSYAILFRLVTIGIKPKAKLVYSCFHDSSDTRSVEGILEMILGFMTILEMAIYISISYDLFKHDKLMKMVLPKEVIRQRHIKNAVDLTSQICRFILEILFTILIFISAKYFKHKAALSTPAVYHIILQGLCSIIHILLSQPLKSEIKEISHQIKYCCRSAIIITGLIFSGMKPSQFYL